jgi:DNA polymerase elongation subunit (family B)
MQVVLDIETVKPSKEEWAVLKGINLETEVETVTNIEKEYEKCVFDGTFSRIVCIGLFILKDDRSPEETIAWYGPNEKKILQEFWNRLGAVRPELIITHNGLGFDLPFLKKRSIINQVKPSIDLNLAKFRSKPVFDTMAEWSNWDVRSYATLDVLARALGVETKSGSGEQIAGMWDRGEWEAIANYCLQDIYVTYACYCRMTFNTLPNSSVVLANKNLHKIL